MIKQLIIDGKKSYDDFGVYISNRQISSPAKKTVKQEIPYSNIVYDFSKINGEIYWNERELKYEFDIAEYTTEKMEVVKSNLMEWLLNVHDTDIYDPYIGEYHFHGSYDKDSWSEDFGAGTISVSFLVYPYKIANNAVSVFLDESEYTEYELNLNNNSSHRVSLTITSTGNFTIKMNNTEYSIGVGTFTLENFYLEAGDNTLEINGNGKLTFTWVEERF